MPVRSRRSAGPRPARSVLGWALLCVLGLAIVLLTPLEVLALWSAATGYWGPEWPTVGRDLVVLTVIWLMVICSAVALLVDRREPVTRRRRRSRGFDRTMRVR